MIKYIDEVEIKNKRVLLRVDFNVALTNHSHIADDFRIRQSIPTIVRLSNNGNIVILIAHLGDPKGSDRNFSFQNVKERLQTLIPEKTIHFIKDFRSIEGKKTLESLMAGDIVLLENIRFYPEEKNNDKAFSQELSSQADLFVNDAFGVSHRNHASIVGIPQLLPSCGGLLLKKEVESISKAINNPQKPYVALIGGAKISTKLHLLDRLLGLADTLIVGGGIANTLLAAQGHHIGRSLEEPQEHEHGKKLIELAKQKNTELILPLDVVVAEQKDTDQVMVKNINEVQERE
ncbi:MAG: phosphoglycerate kinase, partial [Patescibacteria group bacterium]